ncbi:MAG: DUF4062 domain-containing protein [Spirochaetales bacterium]
MARKLFRVFLSSTFGDFQEERELLRREVWPRLEQLCAERGAAFHVVDLRWGIGPQVAAAQETLQVCLDEIARCQNLSPRPKPNFLLLIGDRYGWRPPAPLIPSEDWHRIQAWASSEDQQQLARWYREDTNAQPSLWCLRARTGEFLRLERWATEEQGLTSVLHRAAAELGLSPDRFLYSATHQEVFRGLLTVQPVPEYIEAVLRGISGLPATAPEGQNRRFSDYLAGGGLDPESQELLGQLRGQIREVLPAAQVHEFQAEWAGAVKQPITLGHLQPLATVVEARLEARVRKELESLEELTPFQEDRLLQQEFARETGGHLVGREAELAQLREYLEGAPHGQPLIVRANGGAGKSALLASLALESGAVSRFVGASPRSWHPSTFLEDLLEELSVLPGSPASPPAGASLEVLGARVASLLALATPEFPVKLVIDALDQFSSTVAVDFSVLFPSPLPPHVRLVVSVLEGAAADRLSKYYPQADTLQLGPLNLAARRSMLKGFLGSRRLTEAQIAKLLGVTDEQGSPLWLALAAPLAKRLASWDPPLELPQQILPLVRHVIRDLAHRHGEVLVRSSLSYLVLARFGLSETELQALLWADPDVQLEFQANRNQDQPDVDSLPPIFWSRLYGELDPWINEYWMDGQLLHRYFHRVFGEVADELAWANREVLHGRLADWFGRQPLAYEGTPNGRRLMEQPWHLARAGRQEEARRLATDFSFAMAKCELGRSDDWVEDFQRCDGAEASPEFQLWQSFARSKAHLLRRGTKDWPSHKTLLQLASESADDSPVTAAAEAWLLLGQADWLWFRRRQRVAHAGISNLLEVLEGHSAEVGGALAGPGSLLTWSKDGTLGLWSGSVRKALRGHSKAVNGALWLADGRILSWSDDHELRLWTSDGDPCGVLQGHSRSVTGAFQQPGGSIVSWSADNTLRRWSPSGELLDLLDGHKPSVEGTRAVASPDGRFVSWCQYYRGWEGDNSPRLWSAEGQLLAVLEGHSDMVEGALWRSGGGLVTWSRDGTLRLWSGEGSQGLVLDAHDDEVLSVSELSSGGLLSVHRGHGAHLWTSEGRHLALLKGHESTPTGATELASGRLLTWGWDATLRLWSSEGLPLAVLRGHSGKVNGALEQPEGTLLSWSVDGSLRVWTPEGEPLAELVGHSGAVTGSLLTQAGPLSWSKDGTLRSWRRHVVPEEFLARHAGPFAQLERTVARGWLSRSGDEPSLRLWAPDGRFQVLLSGHTRRVLGFRQLSNGNVLSWSADSNLRLWSSEGEELAVLAGHGSWVQEAQELDAGRILSRGDDGKLIFWSPEGEKLRSIEAHSRSVDGFQVFPTTLLSWGHEGDLALWTPTGELVARLRGHTSWVIGTTRLEGERILSWSADGTLRLWSARGEALAVLQGHESWVTGAVLSPDGEILSWSQDKTARVWNSQGAALVVLEGHTASLSGAFWRKDGSIATWSNDKTVRLWNRQGDCTARLKHGQSIRGVIERNDGSLLSYSAGICRYWKPDGTAVASGPFSEAKRYFRELLPTSVRNGFFALSGEGKSVVLLDRKDRVATRWHGEAECATEAFLALDYGKTARLDLGQLSDNAEAVFTQEDGQLITLDLYRGANPVRLEALD